MSEARIDMSLLPSTELSEPRNSRSELKSAVSVGNKPFISIAADANPPDPTRQVDGALVGDVEPALREEILNVSVAEREAQVDPDRMLDDNRRKSPVIVVSKNSSIRSSTCRVLPVDIRGHGHLLVGGKATQVRRAS
jgi:hypothetical protein